MIMTALRAIGGFLFSKWGAIGLCIAIVGYAEYRVYEAGKDSVRAEAQKDIDAAKADRDKKVKAANDRYDKLETETNQWKADMAVAQRAAAKAANDTLVAVQTKLRAAERQRDKLAKQLKEIPKYVTPQADSACTITTGFVSVYNAAVKASPLPDSGPGNVDAPSGITLSQLADVESSNLAECNERGRVIDAWQEWYTRNKAAYDQLMEKAR